VATTGCVRRAAATAWPRRHLAVDSGNTTNFQIVNGALSLLTPQPDGRQTLTCTITATPTAADVEAPRSSARWRSPHGLGQQ